MIDILVDGLHAVHNAVQTGRDALDPPVLRDLFTGHPWLPALPE